MDHLQALDAEYPGAYYDDCAAAEASDSSDDEIQSHMRSIADGGPDDQGGSSKLYEPGVSSANQGDISMLESFAGDMAGELDAQLLAHTHTWMPGLVVPPVGEKKSIVTSSKAKEATPTTKKSVKFTANTKEGDKEVAVDDGEVDEEVGLHDKPDKTDGEDIIVVQDELYDPEEDANNEQWVAKHRQKSQAAAEQLTDEQRREFKLAKSDAILNCPACMTLLCLDCQRHSIYKTQYRAMFVENCHVNKNELLVMPTYEEKRKRGGKKLRKKMERKRARVEETAEGEEEDNDQEDDEQEDEVSILAALRQPQHRFIVGEEPTDCAKEDLFHPVLCNVCRTECGVFDSGDVFHFFNVLTSYN